MIFWRKKKEEKKKELERFKRQYYATGALRIPELRYVGTEEFKKILKKGEHVEGILRMSSLLRDNLAPTTLLLIYNLILNSKHFAFKGDKSFFAYKFAPYNTSNPYILERLYFWALDKSFPTKSDVLTLFNNGNDLMLISPSSELELMKFLNFFGELPANVYGYQSYLEELRPAIERLEGEYEKVLGRKGIKREAAYGPYGIVIRGWIPETKEAIEFLLKEGGEELAKRTVEILSPIAENFGYYGLTPGVSAANRDTCEHAHFPMSLPEKLEEERIRLKEEVKDPGKRFEYYAKYFLTVKDALMDYRKNRILKKYEGIGAFELTVGEEAMNMLSDIPKIPGSSKLLALKDIKPRADIYLSDGSIDLKTFLRLFKGGFVATGRLEKGEEPVIAGFYARQKFGVASVPGPAKYVIRKMGKDGDEVKVQELYDYPTDKILIARYPVAVWFRLDPPELSEIFSSNKISEWEDYMKNCEEYSMRLSSDDAVLKNWFERVCLHKRLYTALLGQKAYRKFLDVVESWGVKREVKFVDARKYAQYRELLRSIEYTGFFGALGEGFPEGKKYYLISKNPEKSLIGTLPRLIKKYTGVEDLLEEFLKINPKLRPDYTGEVENDIDWPFEKTLVLYFDGWPFGDTDIRYTGILIMNNGGYVQDTLFLKGATLPTLGVAKSTGLKIVEVGVLYNPRVLDK